MEYGTFVLADIEEDRLLGASAARADGKKVGIISHVEALRDRIPVKIMVTRQGNGTSRVEVRRD